MFKRWEVVPYNSLTRLVIPEPERKFFTKRGAETEERYLRRLRPQYVDWRVERIGK